MSLPHYHLQVVAENREGDKQGEDREIPSALRREVDSARPSDEQDEERKQHRCPQDTHLACLSAAAARSVTTSVPLFGRERKQGAREAPCLQVSVAADRG